MFAPALQRPKVSRAKSRRRMPLGWVAVATVPLFFSSFPGSDGEVLQQWLTSGVALLFGIWVFWIHGRCQITAAGLYSLSSAIFVGFAGIWWVLQPGGLPYSVSLATTVGLWIHVAMFALCWRNPPQFSPRLTVTSRAVAAGLWTGVFATGLGLSCAFIGLPGGDHFAIAGLATLMAALMFLRRSGRGALVQLATAGIVVWVFMQTVFTGYGRLQLVSLGLVGLILVSARATSRKPKALTLLGVAPVLVYLVQVRSELGISAAGGEFDGIGSVVNPLQTFGDLVIVASQSVYQHDLGANFLATLVFFVPRSLWADKPLGFGSQLTSIFEPSLLPFGHSMAAHAQGEWFYSFGWPGLVIMIPVVGFAVARLDHLLFYSLNHDIDSIRRFLFLVIVLLLVAGMPTLMWVGAFVFVARAGQELFFLSLFYFLLRLRLSTTRSTASSKEHKPASTFHRTV